jgi:hypothetical protein
MGTTNYSDTTPAAPAGKQNNTWQADAPGTNPRNISTHTPTMVGDSGSGGLAGAVPAPAAGDAAAFKFLQADGTWAVPGGAGATPFDMGFFYPGSPPFASQLIFRAIPTRACAFAAGLSLSSATAVTAATGSTVFSLQKNGSQFGTVTFAAASSSGTFAAASSTSFNGTTDALSVVGPATPDATLANIGVVIAGTR